MGAHNQHWKVSQSPGEIPHPYQPPITPEIRPMLSPHSRGLALKYLMIAKNTTELIFELRMAFMRNFKNVYILSFFNRLFIFL